MRENDNKFVQLMHQSFVSPAPLPWGRGHSRVYVPRFNQPPMRPGSAVDVRGF